MPDRVNADAGLEVITLVPQPEKVGTLSFPVRNGGPIHDNGHRIDEILRRRRPALLLCAGWSVHSMNDFGPLLTMTERVQTVVLVEATNPDPPEYFRIFDGKKFPMKKQFFHNSKTANDTNLSLLNDALPDRSFELLGWQARLLVCGEIGVMRGRAPGVDFRSSVPTNLKEKLRAPGVMILNPTHTRMRRAREVNAWREYLSNEGHVYVSASNWDRDVQKKPSPTLHTFWYDGREQDPDPASIYENELLCYREWHLPKQ